MVENRHSNKNNEKKVVLRDEMHMRRIIDIRATVQDFVPNEYKDVKCSTVNKVNTSVTAKI